MTAKYYDQSAAMMYEQGNLTHVPMAVRDVIPEPTPDWMEAKHAWKWGWQVHTYGFGVLFFLLGLYAIVSAFEFRKRLKVQQYLLGINTILLLLGLSRSMYLFIDPYECSNRLPTGIARVLYGVAFPCLTSSFSLIQMVFMRITRVHMGPNKLQNYRVLAAIITSHFTIVIVIDITVAYKHNLKLLLLLSQSIFITWGLILCFGFVYGGFKMSQFTNETQRVLKQLAVYQRVKQETMKDGNRRDLALHRISKPKLRIVDDEKATQSYYSDTSMIESSESLSFFNEAPLEFDEDLIARACIAKLEQGYRQQQIYCAEPRSNKLQFNRSGSNADLSSESDYVTDTPSTAATPGEEMTSPKETQDDATTNELTLRSDGFDEIDLVPKSTCSSIASIFTVENEINSFINPALETPVDSARNHSCSNGFVNNRDYNSQGDITDGSKKETTEGTEDIFKESGYMADTEFNSPKRRRKKGKHKHKGRVEEEEDPDDIDNNSPIHQPYPLPLTEGTVSLYRIRQGRVLHKTLKISYLTTLLGFICCILELYAMFGVYGVLSSEQVAEPWPWFIFHTVFRMAELGMGFSMATTTYLFGRHRYRPKTKRRRQTTTEEQTKC